MTENLPAVQRKALDLKTYLNRDNIKSGLAQALPKWMSIDRLLRVVFTSTMKTPKLLDCTMESLLQSIMLCAQLGLEPILGRAYLIPYNNSKLIDGQWKKVLECQFQPGYQGLVDLARRSGSIKDVYAMNVYENDEFDLTFGTDRKIYHRPWYLNKANKEPGEIIGTYAVWEMKDGTKHPEFMTISDIHKRRDRSQAYQYAMSNPKDKNAQDCPWIQWAEEQNVKTVIKHSSKLVPASIEFMQAIDLDNSAEIGATQVSTGTLDLLSDETGTYRQANNGADEKPEYNIKDDLGGEKDGPFENDPVNDTTEQPGPEDKGNKTKPKSKAKGKTDIDPDAYVCHKFPSKKVTVDECVQCDQSDCQKYIEADI